MKHEPLRKFIPEMLSDMSKFQLGVIATTATLVTLLIVGAALPYGPVVTVATVLAYFSGSLGILSIGRVQRWIRGRDRTN